MIGHSWWKKLVKRLHWMSRCRYEKVPMETESLLACHSLYQTITYTLYNG